MVTRVRLSYKLNIFAFSRSNPNGPALSSRCVSCHFPGFGPDFSNQSALSVIGVNSGDGGECGTFRTYVTAGDPGLSLIYLKVTTPPCGSRMPLGGAALTAAQAKRLFRWITELTPDDVD